MVNGHQQKDENNNVAVAPSRKRILSLEYSGNLIKHLGLSMYSGAVPALAELISNAWDADASEVHLEFPFDQHINPWDIVYVRDDGRGMTWEDVRDHYLVIGRDRRLTQGSKTLAGRTVMGHKGIGKLAGFGIARKVEVRTVRNNWLVHFAMDFDEMTRAGASKYTERYHPEIIADERCREPNGTTVTMTRLSISRSVAMEEFSASMARRFAILSSQFRVVINGRRLQHGKLDLQFRYPNRGVNTADIDGFGRVSWWIGFTEKPIKQVDARGVAVFVRGRMAQTPFFFEKTGGVHAQFAREYMTGEIFADELDDETDYIGTNRQEITWQEPYPALLAEWARHLIAEYSVVWRDRRKEYKQDIVLDTVYRQSGVDVAGRLALLPERQRREASDVIDNLTKLDSVSDEPEYAAAVVTGIIDAFEGHALSAIIQELGVGAPNRIAPLMAEFGVFDVSALRSLISARLQAARRLLPLARNDTSDVDWTIVLPSNIWVFSDGWSFTTSSPPETETVRRLQLSKTFRRALSNVRIVMVRSVDELELIAVTNGLLDANLISALSQLKRASEARSLAIARVRLFGKHSENTRKAGVVSKSFYELIKNTVETLELLHRHLQHGVE
ncbi:MAG: hypothetical protein JWP08_242 [Bryobacterales bacterium]|nr:hypothetical protein [Bryobacterales bacterium]